MARRLSRCAFLAWSSLLGVACGDATGDSDVTGSGGRRADAADDAASGAAGAVSAGGAGGLAGAPPRDAASGAAYSGAGAAGAAGSSAGAAGAAGSPTGLGPLDPCSLAGEACPGESRCVEACSGVPPTSAGGVCTVPGRDGCGCGAALDPCEDPGLRCLMPACCDAEGVCVTPAERDAICAGAAASRFDCSGQTESKSHLACNLFTGVERIALYARDDIENLCVAITLALGGGSGPTTISVGGGWTVEGASVSNLASDCVPYFVAPPAGETVAADGGAGTIILHGADGGFAVSAVSAQVTLSFPAAAPWVPRSFDVSVTRLPTELPGCSP